MRIDNNYIVIPCDCSSLDHAVIYNSGNFGSGDPFIVIRYPLYVETINPLAIIKNIIKRRFEFSFNIVLDAPYFSMIEYLWKISFPNKIFEYEVMECDPHWKLCFIKSKLTLGFKPSLAQMVSYLWHGVLEYSFEIFIDRDGPSAARYEKIY